MTDNDELTNIPPMVPDREDVASYQSNKKAQGQEIVRPGYHAEKVKVSTWSVRIVLTLIMLTILAAGYGAYYAYDLYLIDMRQAELRIGDLEGRLSLVGNSAEESTLNMIETTAFNFSEIDKLWAARRVTNQGLQDIQSDLAKLSLINEGQDETTANNSRLIGGVDQSLMANEIKINALNNELVQLAQSVAGMNAGIQELVSLRGDIETIRQSLNSGDSSLLGLAGRLEYIEESMESVNAHRLQINESLFRLQQSVEALRSVRNSPGGGL